MCDFGTININCCILFLNLLVAVKKNYNKWFKDVGKDIVDDECTKMLDKGDFSEELQSDAEEEAEEDVESDEPLPSKKKQRKSFVEDINPDQLGFQPSPNLKPITSGVQSPSSSSSSSSSAVNAPFSASNLFGYNASLGSPVTPTDRSFSTDSIRSASSSVTSVSSAKPRNKGTKRKVQSVLKKKKAAMPSEQVHDYMEAEDMIVDGTIDFCFCFQSVLTININCS